MSRLSGIPMLMGIEHLDADSRLTVASCQDANGPARRADRWSGETVSAGWIRLVGSEWSLDPDWLDRIR